LVLAALAGIVAFVLGALIAADADTADPEPLMPPPAEASVVVPTIPTTAAPPSVTTKRERGADAEADDDRSRWDDDDRDGDDRDGDDRDDRDGRRGKPRDD
jgi:hypothetical protein